MKCKIRILHRLKLHELSQPVSLNKQNSHRRSYFPICLLRNLKRITGFSPTKTLHGQQEEDIAFHMRGKTGLLPAKNILKHIHPMRGAWGTMTSVPNKGSNSIGEGEGPITNDKAEPIVAFNKPPLPPILGPFVVLSLLEMGSSHDRNDD